MTKPFPKCALQQLKKENENRPKSNQIKVLVDYNKYNSQILASKEAQYNFRWGILKKDRPLGPDRFIGRTDSSYLSPLIHPAHIDLDWTTNRRIRALRIYGGGAACTIIAADSNASRV